MGYVRVAAAAFLALVALRRDVVRAADQLDVVGWLDGQEGFAEFHGEFTSGQAIHIQF
jgi:hypothetical protein